MTATAKMPTLCPSRRSLGEQVGDRSGYTTINLGAMFRAAGQPAGKDPWAWAELADPVLAALEQYKRVRTRLPSAIPAVHHLAVLGVEDLGPFECAGDAVTTIAEAALIYGHFLDGRLPEEHPDCDADLGDPAA